MVGSQMQPAFDALGTIEGNTAPTGIRNADAG
jgi:hypothetical protein